MASDLVTAGDAIVTLLNAGTTFTRKFRAERKYVPVVKLSDMDRLHVTVVPRGTTGTRQDRAGGTGGSRWQDDLEIDVAIQQRAVTEWANAEIDALMGLVQEVVTYLRNGTLATAGYRIMSTTNVPIYSVEQLEQLRQFTSVITVTVRKVA